MHFTKTFTISTAISTLLLGGLAHAGQTLDAVKKKGFIQCGVTQGLPGFSNFDEKGNWTGVDVDICEAVAAAVFGDAKRIKTTPLSAKERFTALQSGEIDILSRISTWTQSRDTALGLNFAGVNYYDGQGFLVHKSLNIKSARELNGATICTQSGTTTELNLADYFRRNGLEYKVVAFEKADEVIAAYDANRCDAFTTDQSGLYAYRIKLKNPDEHMVLPEVISKEPLGPVVRHGDDEWFDIVKWSFNCMLNAEELDVTSKNVKELAAKTDNPEIKRLVGTEGDAGKNMGVDANWCVNIVAQVGNYGESFQRHLGGAPLHISRGLNALWNQGGLQYAPPIR